MHKTAVRHEEYAPGRDPGRCDIFRSKKLWIQASYRKKDFQLVSVDTLLNWADIGTKAHTSERLSSLLRQMPMRFREEQTKHALACFVKSNDNSVQGHGGDGGNRDAWLDPEGCDECFGGEDCDAWLHPENDDEDCW